MSAFPELTPRRFTPDEYLTLEREADFKSEFYCGGLYAMAGGSPDHSAIASNIQTALKSRLRGRCRVFNSDLKVKTASDQLYTYPDVTVICGQTQFRDGRRDVVANPEVVVEVLSPSTERYDRGAKRSEYEQTSSITDILLVSQDRPQIEHHSRQPNGQWYTTYVTGLGSTLPLPSLGIEIPLTEVYDLIEFAQEEDDAPPSENP